MADYLGFSYNYAATRGEVLAAKETAASRIREAFEKSKLADDERRASSLEYAQEENRNREEFVSHLAVHAWMAKAACKHLQKLFFPPEHFERKDEKLERETRAKAICMSCGVREACLETALAQREKQGIWGGLDESERNDRRNELPE